MDALVSFIVCVNDEIKFEKMLSHIYDLNKSYNVNVEVIPLRHSKSMCSAYNLGMRNANGRIKVYMHQDVYITNVDFIDDILEIFEDRDIGIIGLAGAKDIPSNGRYSSSLNKYGHLIHYMIPGKKEVWKFGNFDNEIEDVICVDGLLMATQYDIKWREDIFDHFHFYDISQCIEFKKRGYRVVIPNMEAPWCIHDCGKSDYRRYKGYELQRERFVMEYKDYLLD